MSADISVVVALLFIGFMVVAATVYSSYDYYRNIVKNAEFEHDAMKKTKMQTDIMITNVTVKNNTPNPSYLNFTVKNTGKTTLNASLLEIFVNGEYYQSYNVSPIINTWVPEYSTNISIYPLNYTTTKGGRFKIVSHNGISDYAVIP